MKRSRLPRLTRLEARAVLSAAGNVDPRMFEEIGKSDAPYYRGMDKLRAMIVGSSYEEPASLTADQCTYLIHYCEGGILDAEQEEQLRPIINALKAMRRDNE